MGTNQDTRESASGFSEPNLNKSVAIVFVSVLGRNGRLLNDFYGEHLIPLRAAVELGISGSKIFLDESTGTHHTKMKESIVEPSFIYYGDYCECSDFGSRSLKLSQQGPGPVA